MLTMMMMMMMMMIAPNSLARQKEGVQRERKKEVGDQRKGGKTGTLTPDQPIFDTWAVRTSSI